MGGPEGSFLWSALCIIPVFLQLRILWGWKLQNLTAVMWGFIFLIVPCPEGTVQGKNSRILIPLGFLLCMLVRTFSRKQTLYNCFSISGFTLAFLAGRMEGQGSVCVSGWG